MLQPKVKEQMSSTPGNVNFPLNPPHYLTQRWGGPNAPVALLKEPTPCPSLSPRDDPAQAVAQALAQALAWRKTDFGGRGLEIQTSVGGFQKGLHTLQACFCAPPCASTALSNHETPSDRCFPDRFFRFPLVGTALSKHWDPV